MVFIQVGVPDGLLARVRSTNGTLLAPRAVVGLSGVGCLPIAGYWLVTPKLRSFPSVVDVGSGAFAPE